MAGFPPTPLAGTPGFLDRPDLACRQPGVPPDLFFTSDADHAGAARVKIAAAKVICRPCPVVDECAEFAIETFQRGVWGATDESERRRERHRRELAGAGRLA